MERQVAFFGVFKAGKSTLINAILGSSLLPSRANRVTGVVTKVSYSNRMTAQVTRYSPINSKHEKIVVSPDQIKKHILLDISQPVSQAPQEIEIVDIGLPLPLLENSFCLVDTPELLDNQSLTERTYQQLQQSELAVMVLPADKLLCQAEKEAAQQVNKLLNGNIVFVVNRIGLIDAESKEEVLDWAATALEGLGNKIVGRTTIFATDAKEALNAKQQNISMQQGLEDLLTFEDWVQKLFKSPAGERVMLLSRLGILEYHLNKAKVFFKSQLTRIEEKVKLLEQEALDALRAEQENFNQNISEASFNLVRLRAELSKLGDNLMVDYFSKAKALIYSHEPKWVSSVQDLIRDSCTVYATEVEQKIRIALSKTQIQLSATNLGAFTAWADISISKDAATGIAGVIGGSTTLAASRWIGKTVFGVNLAEENLNTVSKAAQQSLGHLKTETEKYLQQADSLLDDYSKAKQPKLNTPHSLKVARESVKYYSSVLNWCQEFQNDVTRLKEEMMSWKSDFAGQWQVFIENVKIHFWKDFQDKRRKLKTETALVQLIDRIIKRDLSYWNDNSSYGAAWLEKLLREEPELGKYFSSKLKEVQVKKPLSSQNPTSKFEIQTGIITITIAIVVLSWGQNLQNLAISKIYLERMLIAGGVFTVGSSLISKKRTQRFKSLEDKLTKQITTELENYKKELDEIFIKVEDQAECENIAI